MKTIITYQCEICKKQYDKKAAALKCEAQGNFNTDHYPIGLMFEYHHNGYVGIFAVADPKQQPDSHNAYSSWWACRSAENGCGDSLDHLCGGDFLYNKEEEGFKLWVDWRRIKDFKSAEIIRMAKFLRSQGIKPVYYDENYELVEYQY